MIRIVRTPVIWLTKIEWSGVILTLRMDIVGFSRMTGRPSCLLQQDSGDAYVSVADIETVETAEGIPVIYGADCDDSDYRDPRNEFETVNGVPIYYGGGLNDPDCTDPQDIDY